MNTCNLELYIAVKNNKTNCAGGGVIYQMNEKENKIKEFMVKDESRQNQPPFTEEIHVLLKAIKWLTSNNYNNILINYDYDGIYKWYTGEWKTKNSLALNYISELKKIDNLDLKFQKVNKEDSKYHFVYSLAKRSLLGEKQNCDGSYTIYGATESTIKKMIKEVKEEDKLVIIRDSDEEAFRRIRFTDESSVATVTFYKNTNSVLVQGKDKDLIKLILSYIITYLNSTDTVVNALVSVNPKVDKKVVKDKFKRLLPNYHRIDKNEEINQRIENMLNQTIFELEDKTECYDYTIKLGLALRLSEYYLYKSLSLVIPNAELHKQKVIDKYDRFHFGKVFTLSTGSDINEFNPDKFPNLEITDGQIHVLNQLYKYYKFDRCVYFHINADLNNINYIRSQKDCEEKLEKSLKLFDKFYEVMC